ncbi:MAG: hypothetical protein FWH29_03450 [Methanobrevibacter sp.]|nr:hypothetical protein [Methanobrevibacter sp.]
MIEIDFENIVFMSRLFTQEHVAQKIKTQKGIKKVNIHITQKIKTQKDIKKVNISKDIFALFNMVEKTLG